MQPHPTSVIYSRPTDWRTLSKRSGGFCVQIIELAFQRVCDGIRLPFEKGFVIDRNRASTASQAGAADFRTTHWSVVLLSGQPGSPQADDALEKLCRTYWPPIHAWLQRRGFSPPDAEDLTQSFLSHLLEKNRLQTLHPSKGKFRSFLLTSLKNYLANDWDKSNALKRGAQYTFVSIDQEPGESGSVPEPAHPFSVTDRSNVAMIVLCPGSNEPGMMHESVATPLLFVTAVPTSIPPRLNRTVPPETVAPVSFR